MRKQPMPRGFYREYGSGVFKESLHLIVWRFKHREDPSLDVQCYCRANVSEELGDVMSYWRSELRKSHDLFMTSVNRPRTRKQKAIFKSRMHGIKHISDLS